MPKSMLACKKFLQLRYNCATSLTNLVRHGCATFPSHYQLHPPLTPLVPTDKQSRTSSTDMTGLSANHTSDTNLNIHEHHPSENNGETPAEKRRCTATNELIDVLGDPTRHGAPLALADLFPQLDMAAGRCAAVHAGAPVVTGCLDDLAVLRPLYHGDIIAVNAVVVAVGSRSILIRLTAFREAESVVEVECEENGEAESKTDCPEVREKMLTSYLTFVKTESSSADGVDATPESEALFTRYKRERRFLRETNMCILRETAETSALSKSSQAACHKKTISMEATTLRFRIAFLPRHLNFAGVVFGGDVLARLERSAVSCAARVLGRGCVTLGLRCVTFIDVVKRLTVVQVTARVVACSTRFACVVVRADLDKRHDGSILTASHCGVFYIGRATSDGRLKRVTVGVRTSEGEEGEKCRDEFCRAAAVGLPEGAFESWPLDSELHGR